MGTRARAGRGAVGHGLLSHFHVSSLRLQIKELD